VLQFRFLLSVGDDQLFLDFHVEGFQTPETGALDEAAYSFFWISRMTPFVNGTRKESFSGQSLIFFAVEPVSLVEISFEQRMWVPPHIPRLNSCFSE